MRAALQSGARRTLGSPWVSAPCGRAIAGGGALSADHDALGGGRIGDLVGQARARHRTTRISAQTKTAAPDRVIPNPKRGGVFENPSQVRIVERRVGCFRVIHSAP